MVDNFEKVFGDIQTQSEWYFTPFHNLVRNMDSRKHSRNPAADKTVAFSGRIWWVVLSANKVITTVFLDTRGIMHAYFEALENTLRNKMFFVDKLVFYAKSRDLIEPPCSLDFAFCEFFYAKLKRPLKGNHFSIDEMKAKTQPCSRRYLQWNSTNCIGISMEYSKRHWLIDPPSYFVKCSLIADRSFRCIFLKLVITLGEYI